MAKINRVAIPQARKAVEWPKGHNPVHIGDRMFCTCNKFVATFTESPARWRAFERHCRDFRKHS